MLTREKDIILKIKNKVKDRKLNKNRTILNFIKKEFKKNTVEELTEREKSDLLRYLDEVLK
jgi:hypothetical protein